MQILTRSQNAAKSVLRRKDIMVKCVECYAEFMISCDQVSKRAETKYGPFCSKSCSGKYGQRVQMGQKALKRVIFAVEYYSNDD